MGGQHGCLKLAFDIKKYKLVIDSPSLLKSLKGMILKPYLESTELKKKGNPNTNKKEIEAHKLLWREYEIHK